MNRIERSEEFATWLERSSDKKGKARILSRIDAAVLGNFGDCEPVGEGVSEMRVHFGPGYRTYYTRREAVVYLGKGDVWPTPNLLHLMHQSI